MVVHINLNSVFLPLLDLLSLGFIFFLLVVIELVSGLNSDVEGVLGGLRKALVTSPKENAVRTGLVLRPYSTSLVLNSTPGFLQFYDTDTASLSNEV